MDDAGDIGTAAVDRAVDDEARLVDAVAGARVLDDAAVEVDVADDVVGASSPSGGFAAVVVATVVAGWVDATVATAGGAGAGAGLVAGFVTVAGRRPLGVCGLWPDAVTIAASVGSTIAATRMIRPFVLLSIAPPK